jgi:NAD(P)-dependent dehydrogenase (short-subunit alcohol dehydrogenase family)
MTTHRCDLTLVSECKRLVQELNSAVDSIDYLVLSQGILTMAGRTETTEGNDKKFMLHYYSRIAVINGLLPKLHSGSRVMSVLDSLRGNPSKLNYEDLDLKNHYSLQNVMMHGITMNDITLQVSKLTLATCLGSISQHG